METPDIHSFRKLFCKLNCVSQILRVIQLWMIAQSTKNLPESLFLITQFDWNLSVPRFQLGAAEVLQLNLR